MKNFLSVVIIAFVVAFSVNICSANRLDNNSNYAIACGGIN